MTIICALRQKGCTWIGSDTQATLGDNRLHAIRNKWVLGEGCALGVCGAAAFLTAFEHFDSEIRAEWDGYEVGRWTAGKIADLGTEPDKGKGKAPWVDCSLLFATPRKLMSICATGGAVSYSIGEFCAQGSGDEYAQGAAFVAKRLGEKEPMRILTLSIQAAMHFDTGCGGRVWIEKLV